MNHLPLSYKKTFSKLIIFFLILTSIGFVIFSYRNSENIRESVRTEPENFSYSFDGISFLKTFYHVNMDKTFYEANIIGIQNDARQGPYPLYVSGWRSPVVFYLWKVFAQNGEHIWYLFLTLGIIALWSSYEIGKTYSGYLAPLLSGFFLLPYYYFALTSYQFLLVEWWASSFFLIGCMFFSKGNYFRAIFLFLFAALVREMFAIILIFGFILSFLHKKQKANLFFLISIVLFISFYYVHFLQSDTALLIHAGVNLRFFGQQVGDGGIDFIRQTLAYGTQFFVTSKFGIQISLIALFITLIDGLLVFVSQSFKLRFMYGTLFLFVLLFFSFGTHDNDYWGIFYVPLLFTLFPIALINLIQFSKYYGIHT